MSHSLFDVDVVAPRRGREWGRWFPVPATPVCPLPGCNRAPLKPWQTFTQLALLKHGGYGAARQQTLEVCPKCGWVRQVATESVNPLHAARQEKP